ncbi:MAG: hypothetical protein ACRYGO_18055 [Janthinobacterium lividum]
MSCVIVVVQASIDFYCFDICPESFLDKDGDELRKFDLDDDNGFYDWLRCEDKKIIGVRWFPYENNSSFLKKLNAIQINGNIEVSNDRLELRIFFSSIRTIDESNSRDQDFLGNHIYYSEVGKCAISFSTDSLSLDERQQIFAMRRNLK